MKALKQRIVVGIDGSTQARAALAWALTEAAARDAVPAGGRPVLWRAWWPGVARP